MPAILLRAGAAELIRLDSAYPPRELIQAFAELVQRPVKSPISIAMMEFGGRPGSVEVEKALVHMVCSKFARVNLARETARAFLYSLAGIRRILCPFRQVLKIRYFLLLTTNQRIRSSATTA